MAHATERTPLLRDGADSETQSAAPTASSSTTVTRPDTPETQPKPTDDGASEPPPTDGEPATDASKSFKTLALAILPMTIGTFLASMDSTIVLSSYASIGSELNELQSTSWISTGYMLTLASFQPLYGKLSDIFGRKPCLLFAYVVFALGCLACGLARNMTELIAARAFAGIGGGGMIVSIIMSDMIPLRSRGTWQGLINIIWASGSAVGAPLGGLLADSIGWRWAFLLQVPLTVLALTSITFALHIPQPEASDLRARLARVDFAGAFTLIAALLSLLVGLDRGGNVAWQDTYTLASLAVFLLSFAAFAAVELRVAAEPFAPKRIVADRALLASYLCNFFGVAGAICAVFYVSMYVQAVLKRSAADAGVALLPSIVAGTAASLAGGLVIQATGKYYALTVANYGLMVFGNVLLPLCAGAVGRSFVGFEIGLTLMAFGNGKGGGITTTLISLIAQAGPQDQAIATAVSYLFRSLGSVIGLSVGSTIFQESLRHYLHERLVGHDVEEIVSRVRESLEYIEELEPAARAIVRASYEGALVTSFWFCAGLALCAFVSSLFIQEKVLVHKK
ncbi:MFS general substrate transporter [Amylostereum chailletii]|nr:MFS general substrate transporter [Amylostereum chailletii]